MKHIMKMNYLSIILNVMIMSSLLGQPLEMTSDMNDLAYKIVMSKEPKDRMMHLKILTGTYNLVKRQLLLNLSNFCSNETLNKDYGSPLHVSILAVASWHITEADTILLQIVDYTLDPSSIPTGISYMGDYYYPAIRSLVKLKVDYKLVVDAIVMADNNKKIQLLCWVLAERMEHDLMEAAKFLEGIQDKITLTKGINNLKIAIDLLKSASNSSELIPSVFNEQNDIKK